MKATKIAFMYIALVTAVGAIWLPGYLWQLLITTAVFLVAAAGIEASEMKSVKDEEEGK